MPCRSEYLEPTQQEIESRRVAQLMLFVQRKINEVLKEPKKIHFSFGQDELRNIASNIYGDPSAVHGLTADLCDVIAELKKSDYELFERVLYDGRDASSRKLADWWESHKAFDERRIAREKREAEEAREKEYQEYLRLKDKFEG